jgi:hypothetical protein
MISTAKYIAAAVIGIGLASNSAAAITYTPLYFQDGSLIIGMRGRIVEGDADQLRHVLTGLPPKTIIHGFALDSHGGNVAEASKLAAFIHGSELPTIVDSTSACESACFLVFAAGKLKLVQSGAVIGVHSASIYGTETEEAMAVTTAIACLADAYHVPKAIIGKLVTTPPDEIAQLSHGDLLSMGADFADDAPPIWPSGRTSAPPAELQLPQVVAFQDGLRDRTSWERWFAGTSGDFKDGAEYWAGQRSLPHPGPCYGPSGQHLGYGGIAPVGRQAVAKPAHLPSPVYEGAGRIPGHLANAWGR